jgi:hypothetical protein
LAHRLRFLETFSQVHISIEALEKLNYKFSATGQLIRDYSLVVAKRVAELGDDADQTLQRGRVITACMAARGILESVGTYVDFVDKIVKFRESADKEKLRATVKKHFFASREFLEQLEGKPPHVADGIRFLDKHGPGTTKIYDILCEAVHPNWSGTGALPLLEDESSPVFLRLVFACYGTEVAVHALLSSINRVLAGQLQPGSMRGW